jgi:sigma-E factor negative regulatory protein RseA
MSKETREHLSSLMDGELSPEAGRFLTRRLGADSELNATWQRYHLVRDCLRRPGQSLTYTRLSVDLDALDGADQDPGLDDRSRSGRRPRTPAWLKPLAGTAIAASVAVATVLVTVQLDAPTPVPSAEPFASPNAAGLSRTGLPRLSQPANYSPTTLNRYLQRHSQVAGAVGQKGFVSPLPIVVVVPEQVVESDENPADSSSNPQRDGAGRPEQP